MKLTFNTLWPLVALLAIPILVRISRQTRTDMSPEHLRLALMARSAVILLLTVSLMQPMLYRAVSEISVAYLVDVSESVSPTAIERSAQSINEMIQATRPDHWRVIAFGANAVEIESLQQLESNSLHTTETIDRTATDIEGAMLAAVHAFPPHHRKRIVLISDGNENAGSMLRLIPRLQAESVRIYAIPQANRTSQDTWIESIIAPSIVTAGEAFPVEVRIESPGHVRAEVTLAYGETELASHAVNLQQGTNKVEFQPRIPVANGAIALTATIVVANDLFSQNNLFRKAITSKAPPRILYVEGSIPSAPYLKDALAREGLDVSVASPDKLPSTAEGLDAFDALIVSDVDRSSLTDLQMRAMSTYVHDTGGGFILAGGERIYGDGGYSGTVLEDMLPVTFEARKPPDSVSMIVVLDKSGSMEGRNIEMAREATKAPLEFLKPADKFGVVAFDTYRTWPVEFQPANRQRMIGPISGIPAYGDTDIYPALRDAWLVLAKDEAESKHVILLSDGMSKPGDFENLVRQMADAKVTVSTVAVGKEADRVLLRNIAIWGKGRAYYCEDPSYVPQVFVEESELATGKSLREEPFQPMVKKMVEAFKGIDMETAPELRGYNTTTPRASAEILLETHGGDPILARWHYGLGKAAVFASDVKDRWSAEWLRWNGYPKFWAQLVRDTMRRRHQQFGMDVGREGDHARITITGPEDAGGSDASENPQVRVIAPDRSVLVTNVPRTAPGVHETRIPLTQRGSYLFRFSDSAVATGSRLLAWSYPDEYRFHPPDIRRLQAVADQTGGTIHPRPDATLILDAETAVSPKPVWTWFAALALAAYLGDLVLRRVRLFERTGVEAAPGKNRALTPSTK
jgi:uncharacterized membrane protein/uncharacterized protein YegL